MFIVSCSEVCATNGFRCSMVHVSVGLCLGIGSFWPQKSITHYVKFAKHYHPSQIGHILQVNSAMLLSQYGHTLQHKICTKQNITVGSRLVINSVLVCDCEKLNIIDATAGLTYEFTSC